MPQVFRNVLSWALRSPIIIVVASIIGPSALESAVTSPSGFSSNGLIDAGAASISKDMERLIVASFINTQNVLTDCAMSDSSDSRVRLTNAFTGTDGQPQEGAGRFVVATPEVRTFIVNGLVGLAVSALGLILLKLLLWLKLKGHTDGKWVRFKTLDAAGLMHIGYEKGGGIPEDDWKCCEKFPTDGPEQKLLRSVKWLSFC